MARLSKVAILSTKEVEEPSGLSRTDEKRRDGVTLISWQRGIKPLAWDVAYRSAYVS